MLASCLGTYQQQLVLLLAERLHEVLPPQFAFKLGSQLAQIAVVLVHLGGDGFKGQTAQRGQVVKDR